MNPRLVALRSELLAALGFAALTSACTVVVDGSTGASDGSTGTGTSTTGADATGTTTSAGTSASAGTDSATGTSGGTTASTTANESTGDTATSASTSTTGSTTGGATSDTTGDTTGGTTGGLPECDPVPAPPPDHLQDYACFPLPDGLSACDECVGDCLTPKVDGAITGDPLFCSAQGLVIQCGPDPNAAPGQCCYYAAYLGIVCEGRPLSVDGELRTAAPAARADWLLPQSAPHDDLDHRTRAALARAWADDAAVEHASIAAFARLVLHLLAHGAPPELVAAAHAALADELAHARTCYALASRHGGAPVGPGPLAVDGALTAAPTLADLAVATLLEGCIGETLAAALARVAAAEATDPQARDALATIADDETRHAAFAWRLVRWALAEGGAPIRSAVLGALEHALARPPAPRPVPWDIDLSAWVAHGRLAPTVEAEIIADTLRAVVLPCARALLGEPRPAAAAALA